MRLRRRILPILLVLALAGGAGWLAWHHAAHAPAQTAQSAANGRGRGGRAGGPGGPVPVLLAQSRQQDVPIYLDALGTVQASESVTVHSMVDGPLTEVDVKEGQDVKAGDVLARIDPRPYQAALDQVVAKQQQDQANLANARLDLARYEKLAKGQFTSAQQADTARAQVTQLEAQVKQDQAQIDSARTQLSYTTIKAPIDGRTGLRQVDPGNIVHPTDANGLVVITRLKPIAVLFTLPQQALPQVTAAMQQGTPEVLAEPEGGGKTLDRGQLTVLDNQVDPATGTIKLKAIFPNPSLTLWPGGFVNVRLLVQTDRNVVTVPPAAVQRGPKGAFVFVVQDGAAHLREVTVGHEDETASIILAGLQPGEQVVVDGASRLSDGSKVRSGPESAPEGTPAGAPKGTPGKAAPQGAAPATAGRTESAPATAERPAPHRPRRTAQSSEAS